MPKMRCYWLHLLMVLATLGAFARAQTDDNNWTYDDQEDDDNDAGNAAQGSGTGEPGASEALFVVYSHSGHERVVSAADLSELEALIADHLEDNNLVTRGPTQLEDGPLKSDGQSQQKGRVDDDVPRGLTQETTVNFYPQYAIGYLENGCTAFMISPKHALTSAECVYTTTWQDGLDLWRGKTSNEFLQHMKWSHVIITNSYFSNGDAMDNWALITFHEHNKSPVWLQLGLLPSEQYLNMLLTFYGYIPERSVMYSSNCQSESEQSDAGRLAVLCDTDTAFNGAPLIEHFDYRFSKDFPSVYAIGTSTNSAIRIHRDLFWTLCYLIQRDGEDAGCDIGQ